MIRPSTIFWLMIVAVLGFSLFRVKHEVQALEDGLVRVRRDTATQEEALHVLRAEWTYLNQADRLQQLSDRFLSLAPLTSIAIATIDQLPLRPANAPPVVQPPTQPVSATGLVASNSGQHKQTKPSPPAAAQPTHGTAVAFKATMRGALQ